MRKASVIGLMMAIASGLGVGPLAGRKAKNTYGLTSGGRRPRLKTKSMGVAGKHRRTWNKPHQGPKECARRIRQGCHLRNYPTAVD
ncbi:MAG: hypothetical protein Q2484_17150 [Candidatus Sedimenticola sp. (ex Thyasira tokunagai)]